MRLETLLLAGAIGALPLCGQRPVVAAAGSSASAGERSWTLEQLYKRPYVWGTAPSNLAWAKKVPVLVFLWNQSGGSFRDLYAWHAASKKLVRLTDLEKQKDDLTLTEDEKDDVLKRYLPPPGGLTSFDFADDGKRVAFPYRNDLYVVDTLAQKPPVRLTRTKAPETQPQLSPDGSKLASLRGGQLHVQDLSTGQLWQATDLEGVTIAAYRWSPDGKNFAVAARKGSGRQMPLPNFSGRLVAARPFNRTVAGDESADTVLYVIPAEGGKARVMELGPWNGKGQVDTPEWSDDSARLAVQAIHSQQKKRQILAIDVKTGKHTIAHEEEDPAWADGDLAGWSPDSRSILFTSDRDGFEHIYRASVDKPGKAEQITRGEFEVHKEPFSSVPQWIGDWIYYSSTEGDTAQRHTYRIHPDGTGKKKLSTNDGIHIGLPSDDARYIAWFRSDIRNPWDIWVNNDRVTTSPAPVFHQMSWPEIRFVQFPSRNADRKMVPARLLLPPGYDPSNRDQKPRPAVFFIHGSGHATSVLKQWGSYNELRYVYNSFLANQGFVVLDIDFRGSSGYGRAWRTDVYLHLGGPDLDDVLGGVDYLKSLGNVDTNRLGIWGVSYGGFITDMALFQSPGTFKAGSAWAAVNDWENYNAWYTGQRLNTPEKNPEAYRRSSPIHFSNNLRDHLLIVHGMVDNNVLFQDAVQLAEKLIREGKDFGQAYYPEESHGFVRDETWVDALRRTTEWFERYLK